MRINTIDNSPNFSAKPKNMKAYANTISKGLDVLDKKVGLIIHNSSVPSAPGRNPGVGSLLSKNAEAAFVPFLRQQGISTIQQEPDLLRSLNDPSPYAPVSTSKNIYSIPLEELTTDEYDNFLSVETLEGILNKNSNINEERVNYPNVVNDYDKALREAYNVYSYRTKTDMSDKTLELAMEFSHFKKTHFEELEPNAIYEALSAKYNNEDWNTWGEQDKTLYDSKTETPYLKQLKHDLRHDIEFHMFKQWILERETEKINKINEENGIRIIADTPIAFTPAEIWMNKDLFMKDYALGAPPDFYSTNGQRWDFAILKPESIFNKDGSLGEGGELLKKKYESIFKKAPGGVRIDHVMGLIDPFVYKSSEPYTTPMNSGRLYSSPFKEIFAKYARNDIDEYAAILEKIVIPSAEKYGISHDSIICEDLGEVTIPAREVLNRINLPGITVTQSGGSAINSPEQNVIMLGSHDNMSYIEYTDNFFKLPEYGTKSEGDFMYRTHILGSDTVVPGQDVNQLREDIRKDKKKFIAASFAEMFISPAKKIQVFFTDFFGVGKTYNTPGTKDGCWTLRLNSNFEDLYYKNLSQGLGLNMPEAIATAIRRRGEEFSNKHKNLLKKLDNFTQILKN